jgi:hypothetical protein
MLPTLLGLVKLDLQKKGQEDGVFDVLRLDVRIG